MGIEALPDSTSLVPFINNHSVDIDEIAVSLAEPTVIVIVVLRPIAESQQEAYHSALDFCDDVKRGLFRDAAIAALIHRARDLHRSFIQAQYVIHVMHVRIAHDW